MTSSAALKGGDSSRGAAAAARAQVTRVLLTALLTALVLAGLRGRISLRGQAGPYRGDGIAVGVILEVVLAVLLIALLARARRAPPEALLAARLRTVLRPLLMTSLVVIPVALLLITPLRAHPRPLTVPRQPVATPRPRLPSAGATSHGSVAIHIPLSAVLYALLVIALIAGTALFAIAARRRRRGAVVYPEAAPDADGQRAGLRDAVESGASALRSFDDAQAAIIACYLSMEKSLARAGAVRDAADTPDELLAKAADAGLVRGAAAVRLTGLFYEARFSSHRLGGEQRDAAREALRDLADDLAYPPAQQPPADQPPADHPPVGQPPAGQPPRGPGTSQ